MLYSDDLERLKREMRAMSFEQTLSYLEESIYGFRTPIWPFVSEGGEYSGKKTGMFMEEVLLHQYEDEYLRAYFYMNLRVATTEFETYTIHGAGYISGPSMSTVCWNGGKERVQIKNFLELFCNENPFMDAAGQLYGILKDNPAPELIKFLTNPRLFEEDEPEDEYEDRICWDTYHKEFPEKRPKRKASDITPEEIAKYEKENDPDAMRAAYNAQVQRIRNSFPDKEKYTRSVETFYKNALSFGYDRRYARGDERDMVLSCMKQYMLGTPYTVFSDKTSLVNIMAKVIEARMTSDHAERKGSDA